MEIKKTHQVSPQIPVFKTKQTQENVEFSIPKEEKTQGEEKKTQENIEIQKPKSDLDIFVAPNKKEESQDFFNKTLFSVSSKAPQVDKDLISPFNPLEAKEPKEGAIENLVSFVDEVSGKKVSVPLSKENAEKLKAKFGSLEGANDYVKAWYYDAAYTVGYLTNDKNADGKINAQEGIHLNNLVSIKDGAHSSIANKLPGSNEEKAKMLESIGFVDNISDFINQSIAQDENMDLSLNLSEIIKDDDKMVFFKTTNTDSLNFDMLVIQRFNFSIGMDVLNDLFLNLGKTSQNKIEKIEANALEEEMTIARNKENKAFLDSLGDSKSAVQKSDKLVQNLLKRA